MKTIVVGMNISYNFFPYLFPASVISSTPVVFVILLLFLLISMFLRLSVCLRILSLTNGRIKVKMKERDGKYRNRGTIENVKCGPIIFPPHHHIHTMRGPLTSKQSNMAPMRSFQESNLHKLAGCNGWRADRSRGKWKVKLQKSKVKEDLIYTRIKLTHATRLSSPNGWDASTGLRPVISSRSTTPKE